MKNSILGTSKSHRILCGGKRTFQSTSAQFGGQKMPQRHMYDGDGRDYNDSVIPKHRSPMCKAQRYTKLTITKGKERRGSISTRIRP